MDNYETAIRLLGLRDQNLPPFKEARTQRIKSIQKITNLIRVAERTAPEIPANIFSLDPQDRT